MSAAGPSQKVVCLKGLRNLDVAVVNVFLKLLEKAPRTQFRWRMTVCDGSTVHQPDVVLTSPHVDAEWLSLGHQRQLQIFIVAHRHETLPSSHTDRAIYRPLQFEDFVTLLCRFERAVQDPTRPHGDAPALPSQKPIQDPTAGPVHAVMAHLARGGRVKLKRWPANALLTQHRHFFAWRRF